MKGLTDIEGIKVGHASDFDALTGCTAILCPAGAVAGVDARGGGTGTAEFDTMSPLHVTDAVHGVVLAGGSAFGLEAASGVRRYLAQHNAGFKTTYGVVPIVPSAILYDLGIGKAHVRPSREMGEAAAAAATSNAVVEGCVGAGTGATVGKLFGMSRAMKSGIGSATVWLDGPFAGVRVGAIAAVNAFGDIFDPESNELIAGARESEKSMDLVNTSLQLKRGSTWNYQRQNTTLGVVATNAKLTKVQANKLAQLAQIGLTQTVRPAHTMFDGDMVIAMSHGTAEADLHALGIAAAEALAMAIVRAVKLAKSMGGVPGLG